MPLYSLPIICALILFSAAIATAGELCYSRAFSHAVGDGPYTVCARDLNNDGNTDYIIANYNDNTIVVYRTNTFDNFVSENIYNIGFESYGAPTGLITADLNSDQYLDIVFAASTANVVGVMKGAPNGQFLPPNYYEVGSGPMWVAAGDIDNDGDNDLVTSDAAGGTMTVLLNDGAGVFSFNSIQPVGLSPHCVLLRDFDGDSDLDAVSINRKSQDFSILFNDGAGQFTNRTRYVTDQEPWNGVADDFDSDGDLDLMVTNHIQDKVEIFINDASGHFTHGESYFVGERPMGIIAVDLNGDSLNDLAVTNYASKSQSILINTGGNYEPAVASLIGGGAITLTSIDHNHDGLVDLVFPLVEDNELLINISQGDKGYPPLLGVPAGSFPLFAQAADVNNDGFLDVISVNLNDDNFSVTTFDFTGLPGQTHYFPTSRGPLDAFAADLDRDGDIDIAVACAYSGKIEIMRNNGAGLFTAGQQISTNWWFAAINGADFDDDGDIDLVAKIIYYTNSPGLLVYENIGGAEFAAHPELVFSELDVNSYDVYCRDINNDGDIDILTARGKIAIYYGAPGLSFLPAVEITLPTGIARDLAIADFDGDNDLDLATNQVTQHQVVELINNGSAGFSSVILGEVPLSQLQYYYSYPIDIDGNGWPDIVSESSHSFNNISVILNEAGVFSAPVSMHIGTSGLFGSFDAEGDGDQDLVFATENSRRLAIHLNCNAPNYLLGDCNDDKKVNISDAVFLLNYIFAGGPAPDPRLRGDINGDSLVNISDVVRIINYLFMGEPL
ncbi:MAG: FG-GAP-like repeat-containing protein [Candidatus Zixiibacteriota bacterium]